MEAFDHAHIDVARAEEVPVDYRLLTRQRRWLVYEVPIEGASLVGNYRTQFNRIIETASYEELMKRIRAHE